MTGAPGRWLTAATVVVALCGAPVRAAAQVTVDAPAALASVTERVRAMDLQPLAATLERAGLALPSRIDITLIPDEDPRAATAPDWVVGLASGTNRIVILPDRIGSYPYDSLESVVHHEIAHLALNRRADGRPLPRWFHEGVAVLIERGWGLDGQLRLVLASLRGPSIRDVTRLFGADAQPQVAQAYLLATALVADLVQRHGPQLPGSVAARVAGGLPFDRAFALETGLSPDAAAARAWAGYLRWPTWIPAVTGPSAIWALILVLSFIVYAVVRRRRALRWQHEDEDEA